MGSGSTGRQSWFLADILNNAFAVMLIARATALTQVPSERQLRAVGQRWGHQFLTTASSSMPAT